MEGSSPDFSGLLPFHKSQFIEAFTIVNKIKQYGLNAAIENADYKTIATFFETLNGLIEALPFNDESTWKWIDFKFPFLWGFLETGQDFLNVPPEKAGYKTVHSATKNNR